MLEEKVFHTIQKYELIKQGDRVVVGVSGGPDSIALLSVLFQLKDKLNFSIFVAHINHMIRQEADSETAYVQQVCNQLEIPCFVKKIDAIEQAKKWKMGTEEAGRNIRYAFFEEVANQVGANKIATAHNAKDNAETILMNLLRGSGTSGLKGIEKSREDKFIRPIIECTRDEIEMYCQEHQLDPKYDKTNQDNTYTRNKIRNVLIPYLEREFNPNIVEVLNRLSTIATAEDAFFHKIVENEYQKLLIPGDNEEKLEGKYIILDLKGFNQLDDIIKARLILYIIHELFGTTQGIEKIHIEDIIKLCGNNIGNKYLMPNKKIKVFVKKGKVFFICVI